MVLSTRRKIVVKLEVSCGLSVKLLDISDAQTLFSLVEANRSYLKEWLPWLDLTNSHLDSEAFIQSTHQQYHDGLGIMGGIYSNNSLVGMCGYHPIDKINRCANIGYWIAEKSQGQGIATRCVAYLVDYAFTELQLEQVSLSIAEHNYKSQAIATRLGLGRKDIKRDAEYLYDHFVNHICYSVSRTNWLERKVID
nr:GNAT family protein [Pseudoalteromonas sp. Of7M-16]